MFPRFPKLLVNKVTNINNKNNNTKKVIKFYENCLDNLNFPHKIPFSLVYSLYTPHIKLIYAILISSDLHSSTIHLFFSLPIK